MNRNASMIRTGRPVDRIADAYLSAKKTTEKVAPPKKDPNKIVVESPKVRNPVEQQRIKDRAKGTGGAGTHHNREYEVAKGRGKPKHKKPIEREASKVDPRWVAAAKKLLEANKGMTQNDLHYRSYMRAVINDWPDQLKHLAQQFPGAREAREDLIDLFGKGKFAALDSRYKGNPDGEPVYNHVVDHGVDQPLSGGSDVMKQLQNEYLTEQGRPQREDTPRLAQWLANISDQQVDRVAALHLDRTESSR